MSIAVRCKCGKTLKVKDKFAGKKVRCPDCKGVLAIPAAGAKKADHKDALLRFEKIQEGRQKSAEEEASYRAEQNKLIESYDQLTGKAGKEKEADKAKRVRAGERKRKATAIDKAADAAGVIKGNLFVKYIVFAAIFLAMAVGMVYLVTYVATYAEFQTSPPQVSKEERVDALFQEAEKAITEKRWSAANDALDEIQRIAPEKEIRRDYKRMRKKLEEEFSRQSSKKR